MHKRRPGNFKLSLILTEPCKQPTNYPKMNPEESQPCNRMISTGMGPLHSGPLRLGRGTPRAQPSSKHSTEGNILGGVIGANLALYSEHIQRNITFGSEQKAHLFKGMCTNVFAINKTKQTRAVTLCISFLDPSGTIKLTKICSSLALLFVELNKPPEAAGLSKKFKT